MIQEITVNKMEVLRLFGMAKSCRELMQRPQKVELTNDEYLGLLIDAETTFRENKRLERLLQQARLRQQACIEDLDYRHPRGLHKKTMLELMNCQWIQNKQNVLISGPTGIGKSFIACALGNYACRKGSSTYYVRAPHLFTLLLQSRADGSYLKQLAKLSRFDVLIIDDIGLSVLNDIERKDFLEIVEGRHMSASTVISSQVPIRNWYETIGDPTIADAICDRLLHNAHKIELKGPSMRKPFETNNA